MKVYFLIVGCFCLLYYFIIRIFTKKWNSTFALFWPAAGMVHLLLWTIPLKGILRTAVYAAILVFWCIFLAAEVLICTGMLRRSKENVSFLIVLGAQVRGTRITNSLMRRLDAALHYLEGNPDTKVIVSGGQGKDEAISEAQAMSEYLILHGVKEDRILQEDKSTSTWENLVFSRRLIKDVEQPVAIVTNDFHVFRALLIAKRAGYQNIFGIAASSNPVLQLNYLVREFFAIIWLMLKS